MRTAALASLLLAACWSTPAPSTPTNTTAPTATAPAPPAPVVGIASESEGFSAVRLPAVSQDGSRVLLAIQDGDGGRGYPNLRLELRDRDDKIIATQVVLAADEADGYLQDDVVKAKVAPRLTAANAWLAEQHRALAFVPLTTMHVAADPDDGLSGQHAASAGDVTLEWSGPTVKLADAKATIAEAKMPRGVPVKPRVVDGFQCSNPPYLHGAAFDAAHRVAVIDIGFTGTDSCWEPNNEHHVVAW